MDRQPQEKKKESFGSSILKKRSRHDADVLAEGKDLPTQMVEDAKNKHEEFKQVKSDLDDCVAKAHQNLDMARQIIKDNVRKEGNPDGVLTRKEAQYTECLDFKYRELENLFRKDQS